MPPPALSRTDSSFRLFRGLTTTNLFNEKKNPAASGTFERSRTPSSSQSFRTPVQNPLFSSTKKDIAATNDMMVVTLAASTTAVRGSPTLPPAPGSTMGRLRRWSNVASLLCILDCTVLPLLMVLLPLVGWMGGGSSAALQHSLHHWGHTLALYFVLPVGTTTALVNFASHRSKRLLGFGFLGLLCIGAANGAPLPGGEGLFGVPVALWQEGIGHRILNLLGCAILLGSNYLAQKLGCDCGIPFCQPRNQGQQQQQQQQNALLTTPLRRQVGTSASPPMSAMSMQTRMVQYKTQRTSSADTEAQDNKR